MERVQFWGEIGMEKVRFWDGTGTVLEWRKSGFGEALAAKERA